MALIKGLLEANDNSKSFTIKILLLFNTFVIFSAILKFISLACINGKCTPSNTQHFSCMMFVLFSPAETCHMSLSF